MANDDDIENLLREIDQMTAADSGSEKSVQPAKPGKEVAEAEDDGGGLGRVSWALVAAAGGAGVGLVVGFFLWFLPWVSPIPMGLGAALGAAIAGLVSGPPKWLDD